MSDINEEITPKIPSETVEPPICSTSVRIDKELIKRTGRALRIVCLIALIVGSVGLAAWIISSTAIEVFQEEGLYSGDSELAHRLLNTLLWGSAVLFVCGLVFTLSMRANAKKSLIASRENVYRFYEYHFTVTDLREGENLGTVKTYYSDLAKVRETKEFFFLYPNRVTYFPVDKKKLTEGEIAALKRVLPLRKK